MSSVAENVLKPLRQSVSAEGDKGKKKEGAADDLKANVTGLIKPLEGLRHGWDRWFTRERVDKAAMLHLRHKDTDILVVQGLCPLLFWRYAKFR